MKINFAPLQICNLLLIILLCASCSHKKSIPVVNRGKSVYSKSTSSKNKYTELKNELKNKKNEKNSSKQNAKQDAFCEEDEKKIEVQSGDTLYSIAKKYNTPLRDLIDANNLTAPYSLKKGSILIIPEPTFYQVKTGDTLYSISREYQMNVNDIVALNNLTAPYKLSSGQFIRIKKTNQRVIRNFEEKIVVRNKNESRNEAQNRENGAFTTNATKQIQTISQEQKPAAEKFFDSKNNKFIWPAKGAIISKFGPKSGGLYNDGINIRAKEGAPVKASEDGLIAYVGNELKGYGNLVIIKHSSGWITAYAHLSKASAKRGDKVKKGQTIGLVGATGNVDAPQLYFGLRKGRDAVNPEKYLK